jgi:3,4-dihydroxy 2-butanone 4-phosphate synthase / GTP cyclohydrolase II
MPFDPVPDILADLKAGRMIVLVDDEKRENEGDLVCAAEFASPQSINFMLREARGMMFVAMDPAVCDRLKLTPPTPVNTTQRGTAYTVTVDAARQFGLTTGVSANDRSLTIRKLADPDAGPHDLDRPGHVQPIRARQGGVLVRTGHTEGIVDLCRLAGLHPVGAGIEIMNDDGSMARLPQLQKFCAEHKLKMCCVADIIAYRIQREKLIQRIDEAPFDTEFGQFKLIAYRSLVDPLPHVALVTGRPGQKDLVIDQPVLVRMHAQNLLGDVFADTGQPTGRTLRHAMKIIHDAGEGAIVYLRQDGMGTGLLQRLQTLHDPAAPPPELRSAISKFDFGIGSQILVDLGIRKLRLLTNHPRILHGLDGFGLSIAQHVPL